MFQVSATAATEMVNHIDSLVKALLPKRRLPTAEEVYRLKETTFLDYPTVFAALDITESPRTRVLREERKWYSGKQGCSTMLTIALFSENGKVLGWETGIEGHNNDIGAWQKSKLREWLVQVNEELSPNKVTVQVLADGGFPGDELVLIPLRRADIETTEEREKVKRHAKKRAIVENGIGAGKETWRIMKVETRKSVETQEKLLDTCGTLLKEKLAVQPLRKEPCQRSASEQKNVEYKRNLTLQLRKQREEEKELKLIEKEKSLEEKHEKKNLKVQTMQPKLFWNTNSTNNSTLQTHGRTKLKRVLGSQMILLIVLLKAW
jgi:hypothetical protein